jgi:penicillin-binding protein 2
MTLFSLMYKKRIIILVAAIAVMLVVCVLRLADMQLLSNSFYREQFAQLRVQSGSLQQVRTLRGRILDRNGRVLATDEPRFWLAISYELSRFLDERVRQSLALQATSKNPVADTSSIEQEFTARLNDLEFLINKCAQFGMSREEVVLRLQKTNERIWNLRTFLAWARNKPSIEILKKYDRNLNNIPLAEAIEDFEKRYPDPLERLPLIAKVDDIAETKRFWPVVELKTDDDVFAARVEFISVAGIQVLAKGERVYLFGSTAAQTIGWVGTPQQKDKDYFADDRLSSYLDDEVCGREDGVEYVCEAALRGRRGELIYDIDRQLVSRTEAQFGQDVRLTIDIELQQKIEQHISDCDFNPNCKSPTAAAVLDVGTGEILALVSLPSFDLNRVRQDYGELVSDACEPLRNRAINKQYPPGSVIKPVILTAGLESGEITAGEVISCPPKRAPQGWPSCWIYLRNNWLCHDNLWTNNARNAIKGSCNIYFSHLADRIDPLILQNWLFRFGYGRRLSLEQADLDANEPEAERTQPERQFRQMQGQISNTPAKDTITSFEQVPPLEPSERRWFGIGHGNLRVTPLQVANAMATIARGGVYKPVRLLDYVEPPADDNNNILTEQDANQPKVSKPDKFDNAPKVDVDLNITGGTLATIYEGMHAVVEEPGGTAYQEFMHSLAFFSSRGIRLYGKTGSTTQPEHAWFAGFAKDGTGKTIAIAVIVEGGQQGSSDAAPLARDILEFCVETGYLGR